MMEIIIILIYLMLCTYPTFKSGAIELCQDIKEIIKG